MINVWTVLWVGDKPWAYSSRPADRPRPPELETRAYKVEDVQKYQRMVLRWIPDATFRCLSNVDVPGVECIPLTSGFEGWWPKMELFRPDLPAGRNVYYDLDTLIIREPTAITKYPAPFATIKPGRGVGSFGKTPLEPEPWKPWKDQEGFWRVPRYQTSVMVWDSEYGHRFWEAFTPEHKARLASDQDFLGEVFPNEARMPTEWFRKMRSNWEIPNKPAMVVLSMPMRNDEAARHASWAREQWH